METSLIRRRSRSALFLPETRTPRSEPHLAYSLSLTFDYMGFKTITAAPATDPNQFHITGRALAPASRQTTSNLVMFTILSCFFSFFFFFFADTFSIALWLHFSFDLICFCFSYQDNFLFLFPPAFISLQVSVLAMFLSLLSSVPLFHPLPVMSRLSSFWVLQRAKC